MGLNLRLYSPKNHKNRGIALLITLTIISLLSISLMSVFENRTIEVAHLGNDLERFQAEILSRSAFRAILLTIKEKELVFIIKNKQLWQGAPAPIQNGIFQILEIEPVDHLFNLNRRFKAGEERADIFKNLVRLSATDQPEGSGITDYQIIPAISAINDWTDFDQERDEEYLYDYEYYQLAEPPFEVKNREFDTLSEVRLLEPFRKLGMPVEYVQNTFRVFDGDEYLDVNLADENTVIAYLNRFENVEKYQNVFNNKERLAEIICGGEDNEGTLAYNSDPRFNPPDSRDGEWQSKLEGMEVTQAEKDLFKLYTEHIRICYVVSVGKVDLKIEAIAKVEYIDPAKSLNISGFKILEFMIL